MPYVGRTPSAVPVTADDIPDNSIDASKIVDGAIAVADIGANAVGSSELIDNAVTDAKIADATIVNLKSGRKNLIINGGFDVWQRSTDATRASTGATNYQSADRWSGYYVNREQKVVEDGFNWFKQTRKSSTGVIALYHRIEGHALTGKTVTLSMKCKSDVTVKLDIYQRVAGVTKPLDVSNQTFCVNGDGSVVTYTVSLADYSSSVTTSTDNHIRIKLWTDSVSVDKYQQFTNVQLEVGSVATDFEHRSYGEELALCQRYYERIEHDGSYDIWEGRSRAGSTYVYLPTIMWNVRKRLSPTMYASHALDTSESGFSFWQCSSFTINTSTKNGLTVKLAGAASDVNCYVLLSSGSWIAADAEL